jgi:hypothetical protein
MRNFMEANSLDAIVDDMQNVKAPLEHGAMQFRSRCMVVCLFLPSWPGCQSLAQSKLRQLLASTQHHPSSLKRASL